MSLTVALILGATSSVFIALPNIGRTNSATSTGLQWIVDVYPIVLSGLLLPAGAIGDRWGRRKMLQIGLILFAVGSVGFGLSSSELPAVSSRAIAGVGAAFAFPSTLATITTTFAPERRRQAIAVWSLSAISGSFLGLMLTAVLLEFFPWQTFTYLFGGIALTVAAISAVTVTESAAGDSVPNDLIGELLAVLGVGGLAGGIIEWPDYHLSSPLVFSALIIGCLAAAAFIRRELRIEHPVLNLRLITEPETIISAIALLAMYLLCYGQITISAPYFLSIRHFSPLAAASMFLLYAVFLSPIVLASGAVNKPQVRRRMVLFGLVGMGCASGLASLISAHNGRWLWPVAALLFGAGLGLGQVPATETLVSSLPAEAQGVASAVNDITRELGAALGIAIGGSVLTGSRGHSGNATNDFLVGFQHSCIVQAVIPLVVAALAIALTYASKKKPATGKRQQGKARSA